MGIAAKIAEAFVEVTTNRKGYKKDLDAMRGDTAKASKDMQKEARKAGAAWSKAGRAFAAFVSVAGLVQLSKRVRMINEELSAIGKTADKLGLTTDALQELRVAAELSGVQVNTFDMAMQRFGRRVAEARAGTGEARGAIEELGIELFDATGRANSIENVLGQVADAMRRVSDQTDRNRIAMKLFDSEGVAMVNLLRAGSEGMDRMRQAAVDMGIVFREDMVRTAEDASDKLLLLSKAMDTNISSSLVALTPLILDVATAFSKVATAVGVAYDELKRFSKGEGLDLNKTERELIALQNLRDEEAEILAELARARDLAKRTGNELEPAITDGFREDLALVRQDIEDQIKVIEKMENLNRALADGPPAPTKNPHPPAAPIAIPPGAAAAYGQYRKTSDFQEIKEDADDAAISVGGLARRTEDVTDAAGDAKRAYGQLGESLAGIITQSGRWEDKLIEIVRLLLTNKDLFAAFAGEGNGGGQSFLGSIFSGIGAAFSGMFDGGGTIPRGHFGIAGERGPEIITGPARVISRRDTAAIMDGGARGGNVFNIYGASPDEVMAKLEPRLASMQAETMSAVSQRNADDPGYLGSV